eukprot:1058540-Prorocentrum_minimum.AAC.1
MDRAMDGMREDYVVAKTSEGGGGEAPRPPPSDNPPLRKVPESPAAGSRKGRNKIPPPPKPELSDPRDPKGEGKAADLVCRTSAIDVDEGLAKPPSPG